MVLKEPCGNWEAEGDQQVNSEEHDWYPNYHASGRCTGAEGCLWYESHCGKCGWFIAECGCGCCNGMGKISTRAMRAYTKIKKKARRG